MSKQPRFSIELTIRDNYGPDRWHCGTGCDEALSISDRAVDELKARLIPNFNEAIRIMKQKQLRRDVLMETARQLAAQMADRLEDSEGWHDPERIVPARRSLASLGEEDRER